MAGSTAEGPDPIRRLTALAQKLQSAVPKVRHELELHRARIPIEPAPTGREARAEQVLQAIARHTETHRRERQRRAQELMDELVGPLAVAVEETLAAEPPSALAPELLNLRDWAWEGWDMIGRPYLDDLYKPPTRRQVHEWLCRGDRLAARVAALSGIREAEPRPRYDCERRELKYRGQLVKRLRQKADHQEVVLRAFEEDGWPSRIDDPLPAGKLAETVKHLHRAMKAPILRFRADGTGEGIIWEPADPSKSSLERP